MRLAGKVVGRAGFGTLLASSSIAALMLGGGAPPAYAACNTTYSNTTSAGCTNSAAITGIAINNSTITTAITNSGTISPNGIVLTNASTITGGISDTPTGTISGGISVDRTSKIGATGNAVQIFGPLFAGGIINGGTISSTGGLGIVIGTSTQPVLSSFSGGVTNSGTITAAKTGIAVSYVSTFSGGITNTGQLTVSGNAFTNGIVVEQVTSFAGGISNSGTISSAAYGIDVGGLNSPSISNFSGGIANSGTITSAKTGMRVSYVSTFSGGVTNSGKLVVDDTALEVFEVSVFSGGITNSGTISAQDAGITATGISLFAGAIVNTGTITARSFAYGINLFASTFTGGITNTGTIAAPNGGDGIHVDIVTLFENGISNSGTIAAGATGILLANVSTFMGGMVNNGTISGNVGISISGISTFSGDMLNSGTISAAADGILISGVSTFLGSIINTGTISAAHGIVATGATGVSVFDSGTIIGTSGFAINFGTGPNTLTLGPGYDIQGKVIGSGTDILQLGGAGSGNFDLGTIGATQYEGFTTFNVVGGVWNTTGTFGQIQTWNVNGGTLAGTGTFDGIQVNAGGTLEPGTPGTPGTFMTLNGNLAFASGAVYLVNLNPTTASRANVTGSVTLNGQVEGFLAPGSYSKTTTYNILDPSSISGTFTGFTAINAPGFSGTLTYQANDVLLNLTAQIGGGGGGGSSGGGGSLNPNQQGPANSINTYFNNGGTLPAGFLPLFGLSGAALGNALAQISGEPATDAGKGANQLMNDFLDLMLDPTASGGGGVNGGGATGFAPEQDASLPADVALAYAKALKAPAPQSQQLPSSFDQRWTAWGSAFGGTNFTDGNAALGTNNVNASDYGFAAGMDYRATPNVTYGFGLTGGGTNWNLAQGLGSGRSDAFGAGVYAKTHWGPLYFSGALAFANHWFTTSRIALGDQLQGTFTGQSYAARGEVGYRYAVPVAGVQNIGAIVGVTPYAALQAQDFHTPSYSETDLTGGGLGLAYNSMNATDTRSELGARFDNLQVINGMPLVLRGRLAWAHDWYTNATALNAAFQTLPGSSFTVNGAAPPKNSALTTAAAELHITSNWTAIAKFDGEFGSGSQTYGGTGTLRYSW